MMNLKFFGIAVAFLPSLAVACPIVEREVAAHASIDARQSCPPFDYSQQGRNWASQCQAWALCGNGKQQSPINLPANTFASTHQPTFAFPGGSVVHGEIFDRGFGPEWEPDSPASAPTLRFDGNTYTLLQWHTHTPTSEHAFGGHKTRAEVHFVFALNGAPKSVAGVPLSNGATSQFAARILRQVKAQNGGHMPTDPAARYPVDVDFSLILNSYHFTNYWTYNGSLTTPDCSQGLRWFVSGRPHTMNGTQFQELESVSIDSVRALQPIINQNINV